MNANMDQVTVGTQLKRSVAGYGSGLAKNDHIIVTGISGLFVEYRLIGGDDSSNLTGKIHTSRINEYEVIPAVRVDAQTVRAGDVLVYTSTPDECRQIESHHFWQIGRQIKITSVNTDNCMLDAAGDDTGFLLHDIDSWQRYIFMIALRNFAKVNPIKSVDVYSDYEYSNDESDEPNWDSIVQKVASYKVLKEELKFAEKSLEEKRIVLEAMKAEIIGALE